MINPALSALGAVPITPQAAAAPAAQPAPQPASGGGVSAGLSALGATPIQDSQSSAVATPAPSQSVAPSSGPIPIPFPSTGKEGAITAGGHTLGNLIPSTLNFGANVIKQPFTWLQDLAEIPGNIGSLVKESGGIIPAAENFGSSIGEGAYNTLIPDFVKQGITAAAAASAPTIGSFLGTKPGVDAQGNTSMTHIKARATEVGDAALQSATADIENDPVGAIAPLVLMGSAAAHGFSPEAGAAFDSGVSKMASPVMATGSSLGSFAVRTGNLASSVARFGVGQAMGLDPSTMSEVIANPGDYTAAKMADTTRTGVATIIKDAVQNLDERFSESGKEYAPFYNNPTMIDLGTSGPVDTLFKPDEFATQIQKATGLVLNKDGDFQASAMSRVDSPTDVTKVQRLYDQWQPYFGQGLMTSGEFLTLRGKLAKIANYEGIGKSAPLESAAANIRTWLNNTYRDQVPGLAEKDADHSSQSVERKQLTDGLLDNDGNLRDSDINKIANATGMTKAVFLSKLEQLSPGITDKINALKAIEDIEKTEGQKVGTYARTFGSGGAVLVGLGTGNLPLIIGGITEAILASPSVAIPMLRAYGYSKALVSGVAANLSAVATKVNDIPNAGVPTSLSGVIPRLRGAAADFSQLRGDVVPSSIRYAPKSIGKK